MIELLIILFFIIGATLIISGMRLPSQKEKRLLKKLCKPYPRKGIEERVILPAAAKIARHIRLTDDRREKLNSLLKNNGYTINAELYTARNLVVAALFLFVSLLLLIFRQPIMTVLSIIFIVLSVVSYFKLRHEVDDRAKKKRAAIQKELPQFMMTMIQALRYDRNIMATADKYRLVAGPELKRELDKLVLDMKTINQEQALKEFADRIDIEILSNFVTGLISESRGINQEEYLKSVESGLRKTMYEGLKKEALKRPGRMRAVQFAVMCSALIVWLTALGYQIVFNIMNTLSY